LPLPSIGITALHQHLSEVETTKPTAGSAWQHTGLIFHTASGAPVDPRNFNRSWDARCLKAGVRKITVHDARRTCASLLADLDIHPRIAMTILRHARFSITMEIYTQVSSKATREALKRLGDSLDG
jgi:integrase